jgi:hypothetical protein
MSFDQFLNSEKQLIDQVVENAEQDAVENATVEPNFIMGEDLEGGNTTPLDEQENFQDSQPENPYHEADILDEEIFQDQSNENLGGGTATVESPFTDHEEFVEQLSDLDKKRNFLYCQLYVLMMSEAGELVFKLIAGDLGNDTGNKYTISKTKQNDIARAWAEVLNFEMEKKTPKGALVMMIISTFVPLLVVSIKERVKKNQEKKKQKHQEYTQEVKEAHEEIIQEAAQVEPDEPPAQILEHDFTNVDDKQTAQVRTDHIEKEIETDLPIVADQQKGKRGAKRGKMKNPLTGKREMYTGIVYKNGKPYFKYSWGATKIIPMAYRHEFMTTPKK